MAYRDIGKNKYMAKRNVKLTIAYDGSNYHGWQRQPGGISTVQEVLEKTCMRVVKHPVKLRASGRTDTGVHAAGQVANFRTDTLIPDERLHLALNSRLPRDIRVRQARQVDDDFDSLASSTAKLYRYTIYNHTDLPPRAAKYCYHFYRDCNLKAVQAAAAKLIGEHDFASFAGAASNPPLSTIRTIWRCEVFKKYHWIYVDIEGSGFLYHMVRNIVGTLLEIGRGYWPVEKIDEILAARDRAAAGPMAPADGLCLMWVKY
jgi:tRNA pseudouridine38-40 synthase